MIKKRRSQNSVLTRKGKINREKAVYKKETLTHQIPVDQIRKPSEGRRITK